MRMLQNGRVGLKHSILLLAVASMALSGCGNAKENSEDTATIAEADAAIAAADAATDVNADTVIADIVEEPTVDSLTGPQRNAVRSATSYLNMTGFSRDGLIEQLSSDAGEGYSVADATAAVDSLDVDWNANAVKSAQSYLDMTGFSCNGLIEQLSSSSGSQYTVEQATYGARAAGAC